MKIGPLPVVIVHQLVHPMNLFLSKVIYVFFAGYCCQCAFGWLMFALFIPSVHVALGQWFDDVCSSQSRYECIDCFFYLFIECLCEEQYISNGSYPALSFPLFGMTFQTANSIT